MRIPVTVLGAALLVPALGAAQDLTPRAYYPTPVSTNAVVLTYVMSDGDVVFDPTVPVTDSTARIHGIAASYYRGFNFVSRAANLTATVPFAEGDVRGKVSGQEAAIHRSGLGDVVVRVAVNLWGGPARSPREFVRAGPIRSVLGASVKVVMPTGQYDNTRLINLGTNRWGFKPELGFAKRVPGLIVEAYGGVWLFTANDDFPLAPGTPGGARKEQAPIGSFEAHVSHDVSPRLWISADFNYWHGGKITVDGARRDLTLQSNSRVGVTASLPLGGRHSVKISYSDGLVVRLGGEFKTLSVGYQYSWFGNPLAFH